MDDYLAKPLSLKALATVLARWVPGGQDVTVAVASAEVPPASHVDLARAADPAVPVLDEQVVGRLERLGKTVGEDLMGQLVILFLADADASVVALREALAGDDAAAVIRSAHTLSGASANLGATDLARLCATLATDGARPATSSAAERCSKRSKPSSDGCAPPSDADPDAMKILVADDDPTSRLIAQTVLQSLGHDCHTVSDGAQAWDAFRIHRPDVVISDWMMPGLTGLQLCRNIRAHAPGSYTYFIMVTGQGGLDEILEGMGAGADDYLIKPLDPDDLQARLIAAARVTSLHRQLAHQRTELERSEPRARRHRQTGPAHRTA